MHSSKKVIVFYSNDSCTGMVDAPNRFLLGDIYQTFMEEISNDSA